MRHKPVRPPVTAAAMALAAGRQGVGRERPAVPPPGMVAAGSGATGSAAMAAVLRELAAGGSWTETGLRVTKAQTAMSRR